MLRNEVLNPMFKMSCVLVLMFGAVFNGVAQERGSIEAKTERVEVIELFVMSGTPVVLLDVEQNPNVKAVLHVIDEADLMMAGLNKMLKNIRNEAEARALMQPYFQDEAFVSRLKRAHLSKIQAERYRLTEYPAAVINRGKGLVLGHVDMNEIVELVNEKRGLGQ